MCNGTPFTVEKISPCVRLDLGTARSVGQRLTNWASGAPTALGRYIRFKYRFKRSEYITTKDLIQLNSTAQPTRNYIKCPCICNVVTATTIRFEKMK